MIFYFSGTGNSRRAAQAFAQGLNDELLDAAAYLKSGSLPALSSETPWVFVCPTYAWRMPRVFEALLRDGRFEGSREAWFVMTCGSEVGNAADYIRPLCEQKGWRFRGLLQLPMPENYLAMFPVPDEAECAEILAAANKPLRAAIRAVAERRDFPAWKPSAADRLKSGLVHRAFYRLCITDKPFAAGGDCTGCGHCENLCPTNNIRLTDGRPIWGGHCLHCMACISHCPTRAIEYGRRSRNRARWQCPDWPEE